MSIKIQRVALTDLPFEPGTGSATRSVLMQAEPEKDFAADGGIDPLDWMDLTGGLSRLIAADEVVLNASQATLVLWYPAEVLLGNAAETQGPLGAPEAYSIPSRQQASKVNTKYIRYRFL